MHVPNKHRIERRERDAVTVRHRWVVAIVGQALVPNAIPRPKRSQQRTADALLWSATRQPNRADHHKRQNTRQRPNRKRIAPPSKTSTEVRRVGRDDGHRRR